MYSVINPWIWLLKNAEGYYIVSVLSVGQSNILLVVDMLKMIIDI